MRIINKHKLFIFIYFTLVITSSCTSFSNEKDAFNKAQNFYNEKNYIAAKERLTKLANLGNASAQSMLGNIFFFGLGVEANYGKSLKWRLSAAKQGLLEAQYQLAGMYLFGYGTQKNINEAISWLEKASKNGHSSSAVLLGQIYEQSLKNTNQDLCKAAHWYKSATDEGDPLGYFMLHNLLLTNNGVKCN